MFPQTQLKCCLFLFSGTTPWTFYVIGTISHALQHNKIFTKPTRPMQTRQNVLAYCSDTVVQQTTESREQLLHLLLLSHRCSSSQYFAFEWPSIAFKNGLKMQNLYVISLQESPRIINFYDFNILCIHVLSSYGDLCSQPH